jgi:hypothetical protein
MRPGSLLNIASSAQYKRKEKKHDENKEQDFCNRSCSRSDAEKAKSSGDYRNDEKNDCPA